MAGVSRLQGALRMAAYLPITVDGVFGPVTESRVREFQRINRLKVDGVVGKNTWSALSAWVRDRQADLKALGMWSGTLSGSWSRELDSALRAYQRKRRLGVDGIWGPQTRRAVLADRAVIKRESVLVNRVVSTVSRFLDAARRVVGSHGRRWYGVVVHHSATQVGNVDIFRRAHLARGWRDIGYHAVIGNGTAGLGDGEIALGRSLGLSGAHCPGQNTRKIGICLVGDFTGGRVPSAAQLKALTVLTKAFKEKHGFSAATVTAHRDHVPTACPGSIDVAALRRAL
ncbi:MAG: peptidoglycan-binding protein [Anaerosomatales bacterium]|nr:peptidoglycan-binding protein [Anaerosomatales bacterium]